MTLLRYITHQRTPVARAKDLCLFTKASHGRGFGRRQVWSYRPRHQPQPIYYHCQRIATEQDARWLMHIRNMSVCVTGRGQYSEAALNDFAVTYEPIRCYSFGCGLF